MLKTIALRIGAALLLSMPLAQEAHCAPELVRLPRDCPTTGPHRGCLFLALSTPSDSPQPAEILRKDGNFALLVRVRGRFAGSARNVRLMTSAPGANDGYFMAPYLGRSKQNHPIVLTDRGPFEILSGLDFNGMPGLVVIDEPRSRVIAEYFDVDFPTIRISPRGISAFVESGDACVSAPRRIPGLLVLDARACEKSRGTDGWHGLPDYLVRATGPKTDIFKRLIPEFNFQDLQDNLGDGSAWGGSGWGIYFIRDPGTPYLLVFTECGDCRW